MTLEPLPSPSPTPEKEPPYDERRGREETAAKRDARLQHLRSEKELKKVVVDKRREI